MTTGGWTVVGLSLGVVAAKWLVDTWARRALERAVGLHPRRWPRR